MNRHIANLVSITAMLTYSSFVAASDPPNPTDICVRNFHPEGSGLNPCGADPIRFVEVVSALNPEDVVCTKIYEESYCKNSPKEFRHVETADGKIICTVHFHQPGVAEYCYSNPKIFSWAKGK